MNGLFMITRGRRILLICYLVLFLFGTVGVLDGNIQATFMYWFIITITCSIVWILIPKQTHGKSDLSQIEVKKIAQIELTAIENRPTDSLPKIQTQKKPYWKTWLKCTVWILVLGCFLGLGSGGMKGLAVAIGAGIILAPIKGAILAFIIRAFSPSRDDTADAATDQK